MREMYEVPAPTQSSGFSKFQQALTELNMFLCTLKIIIEMQMALEELKIVHIQ